VQSYDVIILFMKDVNSCHGGGQGRSDTMSGRSPGCFFWVLPMRSIPKPDQDRNDIIQQQSLGADVL